MKDNVSRTFVVSSCEGKRAFSTPQLASKVQRHRARKKRTYRVKQHIYRCKACGLFHIGTESKPVQHTKSGRRPRRADNQEDQDGMSQ